MLSQLPTASSGCLQPRKCFFAEPICSLGAARRSQSHQDDEEAAKIEISLLNSALAPRAGDGNKDCPGSDTSVPAASPLGSKRLPGKAGILPRGGRERGRGFLSTKNRQLILLSFGAANLLLRRNHSFSPILQLSNTHPLPSPPKIVQ